MADFGLQVGDMAPLFNADTTDREGYAFGSVGGRYVLLAFLGSAALPDAQAVVAAIQARRDLFDDRRLCFFGISIDPADRDELRLKSALPGLRYFWDFNHSISAAYRVIEPAVAGRPGYRRQWVLLDPELRVMQVWALGDSAAMLARLESLPPVRDHAGVPTQAPVLIVPRVFDEDLCQRLIAAYVRGAPKESGVMRTIDGMTVGVMDSSFKRRSDLLLDEEPLREATRGAMVRALAPAIRKAFAFTATRIERYLVACYDSDTLGFFSPHRDDDTAGTAHRRFAVTINLNFGEYSGGALNFPEYGDRLYDAPRGGAVVFSCSILHEVRPVTAGRRYAFLPFLYDEAAAAVRAAKLAHVKAD